MHEWEKARALKRGGGTRVFDLDAAGSTKQGEVKCKLNVEHAKSALWFGCPGVECTCGDFDLTDALAAAVAAGASSF